MTLLKVIQSISMALSLLFYVLDTDAAVQPGVPEGRVIELKLPASRICPGFEHEAWLYIPAQYDGETPIAFIAFQDGASTYLSREGCFRTVMVLNNLVAKRELPVMAAIFIDPDIGVRTFASDGSPLGQKYDHSSVPQWALRRKPRQLIPVPSRKVLTLSASTPHALRHPPQRLDSSKP